MHSDLVMGVHAYYTENSNTKHGTCSFGDDITSKCILHFIAFQSGKTIKKWTSYFDYVGVDARKPLFFGEGNIWNVKLCIYMEQEQKGHRVKNKK